MQGLKRGGTLPGDEAGRGTTRRQDGSVDFYCSWTSYKAGFGSQESKLWLGNENFCQLKCEGMITPTDHGFRILGEADKYQLVLDKFLEGSVGRLAGGAGTGAFGRRNHERLFRDLRVTGEGLKRRKLAWWKGCSLPQSLGDRPFQSHP
ncbi:ficolin-3 [Sarcophilus harrisii]